MQISLLFLLTESGIVTFAVATLSVNCYIVETQGVVIRANWRMKTNWPLLFTTSFKEDYIGITTYEVESQKTNWVAIRNVCASEKCGATVTIATRISGFLLHTFLSFILWWHKIHMTEKFYVEIGYVIRL